MGNNRVVKKITNWQPMETKKTGRSRTNKEESPVNYNTFTALS